MMEYGLVALWLVLYLALLVTALPLASALFAPLADRGIGVALPLSLAVVWIVAYWVGHASLVLAAPAGIAVLLAASLWVVWRRSPRFDLRVLVETAFVFTLAFLFLIAVRAVDPAVVPIGGEKFLDYGLLKSLLRAETLPPEDMWFAGEPVSYYYGGHLLASLLTRLTGTDAQLAYNLALAGFYAALVTGVYGLAGSIAAERGSPRWLGGILGAFFVGFASNLSTLGRLVLWLLPDGPAATLRDTLSIEPEGLTQGPASFHYWDASRIIEGTINEFPLFAWLNGDLHAHMMSQPFLVLAAALLYSYYLTPNTSRRRRRLLVFGAVPPLAGMLAVVNTWSFPTIGGLAALAVLFGPSDPRSLLPVPVATHLHSWTARWRDEGLRHLTAGTVGALVVLLGLVWSGPFWFGTASTRSIGLFPQRSGAGELLVVHGVFLVVFVPYLLRFALPRLDRRLRIGVGVLIIAAVGTLVWAPAVALFVPLVVVGWTLLRVADWQSGRAHGETAAATADGGSHSGSGSASADQRGKVASWLARPSFETVLVIAGAGLVVLVEFIYVKEQAATGRFNTVFKTYSQVWVLWSLAAGAALAHLLWQHRPDVALSGGRWTAAFRVLAAVLVVSTSLYGAFALSNHFTSQSDIARTGDPTLNATAFLETRHPDEAPAIRWLDAREGRPTITSAPGDYSWRSQQGEGASAPASLTGLPTVVGWSHEIGYRGETAYRQRAADVESIYTADPATRAELLASYDVQYVYVGPAERARYGPQQFAGLDGVTVAKQWDEVTIYRVDQSALGVSETE